MVAVSLSMPAPKGFASHLDNNEFYDDLESSRLLLAPVPGSEANIAPRVDLPPEDTLLAEEPEEFIPLPASKK